MNNNQFLCPIPIVKILIYNQNKEILLIKNPTLGDFWTIPEGKIKSGETMLAAAQRVVKEKTNLEVDQLKFLFVKDGINPTEFQTSNNYVFPTEFQTSNYMSPPEFQTVNHFLFLNFIAHLLDGEITPNSEIMEHLWCEPQQAFKKEGLSSSVVPVIKAFINQESREKKINWQEKYYRVLADWQNFTKQAQREKTEFIKFALADFLPELLPVYDHLKLSLADLSEAENNNAWVMGVKYVLRQFKELLKNHGLQEITTINQAFDHQTMEAIEGKGDWVIKELKPGYLLHGNLFQAAKVVLGPEKIKIG